MPREASLLQAGPWREVPGGPSGRAVTLHGLSVGTLCALPPPPFLLQNRQ